MKLITLIITLFWSCITMSAENSNEVTTQIKDAQLGLTIKGNQELPNVLYIIPWKKGPKNDISPIQGRIVDEVYGPIEANVFKRRVKLFRELNTTTDKSDASSQE